MKKASIAAVIAMLSALVIISCERDRYRDSEGMVWHTTYHVTYRSDRDLTDSIVRILSDVGNSLNVFDSTSTVSKVNIGDSVAVDPDFLRVYEMSRHISSLTDGAFDPTLGPLITAWGFGKGHKATSDTLRIDSLLAITGIGKTRIDQGRIIKGDPRIQFNFSAIAKGYGCDRIGEMLTRNGVADYLVEIGGEIRCAGFNPQGGKWRISIDRPLLSDSVLHESQCIIALSNHGLATSGNYRNFHRTASGNYGHTISAATGRPAETDVLSATVISASAMGADALATAMMAMGSQKAKDLAARMHVPAMLVLADSTVWQNDSFMELVVTQ